MGTAAGSPLPEDPEVAKECVGLLQVLIRNACVNDGTPGSGQERRSVDALVDFFGNSPLDIETFEPELGRASLVARIDPPTPEAPTLCYLGHLDVVPANPDRWRHDPFGGELIDGEVWGRGAVDMLKLTSTMAFAARYLSRSRKRPPCGLAYVQRR